MKKSTKKVTESTSQEIYVAFEGNETATEIKNNIAMSKVRSKVPLTENDVEAIMKHAVELAFDALSRVIDNILNGETVDTDNTLIQKIVAVVKKANEKKPWYKRLWDWIRGK